MKGNALLMHGTAPMAVTCTYRALHPYMNGYLHMRGFTTEQGEESVSGPPMDLASANGWAITAREVLYDGHRCLLLERKRTDPRDPLRGMKEALWVDPGRDFVILRHIRYDRQNGVPSMTLSFSYREDREYGPVPSRWTFVFSPGGNFSQKHEYEMQDYALNVPIDPTEFRLEFPRGTLVTDGNKGISYVITESGGTVRVRPEDLQRGASYDEFYRSGNRSWRWWLTWSVAGCLMLATGLVVYQRWFREWRQA